MIVIMVVMRRTVLWRLVSGFTISVIITLVCGLLVKSLLGIRTIKVDAFRWAAGRITVTLLSVYGGAPCHRSPGMILVAVVVAFTLMASVPGGRESPSVSAYVGNFCTQSFRTRDGFKFDNMTPAVDILNIRGSGGLAASADAIIPLGGLPLGTKSWRWSMREPEGCWVVAFIVDWEFLRLMVSAFER
jgi:hypothetical protein